MMLIILREMVVRLGFSHDKADEIFNGKGIELIDKWLNLYTDDVKTLRWNVKIPGGGGHGEMISFKTEMNLHLTIFFVCHKNRTS